MRGLARLNFVLHMGSSIFAQKFGREVAGDAVLKQAEVSPERPRSQRKPVLEPSLQRSYRFGFSKFCVESTAAVRPSDASCLGGMSRTRSNSRNRFNGATDSRIIHGAA